MAVLYLYVFGSCRQTGQYLNPSFSYPTIYYSLFLEKMDTKNQMNETIGVFDRIETNEIQSTGGDLILRSSSNTIIPYGDIIPPSNNDYRIGNSSNAYASYTSYIYYTPSFGPKFTYLQSGPARTILTSDTQIDTFAEKLVWRSGSANIKFPQKGLYQFVAYVEFDSGATANYFDLKLRETGGATSDWQRCITGPLASISERPFKVLNRWYNFSGNDIVQLVGNRSSADVSGVFIRWGFVFQIECFE